MPTETATLSVPLVELHNPASGRIDALMKEDTETDGPARRAPVLR